MQKRVSVIGSGAWGTTLAKVLADNGFSVYLWTHSQQVMDSINLNQINELYLPNIKLPLSIKVGLNLKESCDSRLLVLATTSSFFKSMLMDILPFLTSKLLILNATKGLNPTDFCRMSEVAFSILPKKYHSKIGFLSGPNISMEIALEKPAATVVSSSSLETANKIRLFLQNNYFRVCINDDIIGTELGGTLKNIIAIAAGIIDGLDLGTNVRSVLIVRGMMEIESFAIFFGAKKKTLDGISGMGDLITTCSSPLSRNHLLGKSLAKGITATEFLSENNFVVEGVETCRFVYHMAKKNQIEMPITQQIYEVLFEDKPIKTAIKILMSQELNSE